MKRGARTWARFTALAVTGAMLSTAVPALGQDSLDDLARRHFESGVAYLQESDYDNALQAFQKAYELSKRPEILLNIATVNERKADLPAAVKALETYLEVQKEGGERETTEARLANLKKRIEEEKAQAAATAPSSQPDSHTPANGAAPTKDTPPAPPPNNTPAFVLLGVGGAALIGAGITGVIANGKYNDAKDSCSPNCTDDDVSSGKTMALTSTILTGVGLVSAGIGAVLLFTNGPSSEKAAKLPPPRWDVGFGVAPGGAAASARWRF
jgi:hypothetical protein